MKMDRWFVAWIVLISLVSWGYVYEGAKVVWFMAGGTFLVLVWIGRVTLGTKTVVRRREVLYLLWLLALVVASFYSDSPLLSVVGGSYRHQGVIFFFLLFLVSVTLAGLDEKWKYKLLKSYVVVVVVEALLVIVQAVLVCVGFGYPNISGYPLGTLGEPNAVAGFLGISGFLVFLFLNPRQVVFGNWKMRGWMVWGLVVVAVLVTGSVSGLLSLLVSLLGGVFFWKKVLGVELSRLAGFVGVCVLCFVILISLKQGKLNLGGGQANYQVENRVVIWRTAVEEISKRPIVGYGLESNQEIFRRAFEAKNEPLSGVIIDRSHNIFLDLLLWSGVLGVLAFVLWFVASLIDVIKIRLYAGLFGSAGWLVFAMLQPLSVVHWVALIVMLGLVLESNSFWRGWRG